MAHELRQTAPAEAAPVRHLERLAVEILRGQNFSSTRYDEHVAKLRWIKLYKIPLYFFLGKFKLMQMR